MITAVFKKKNHTLVGLEVSGHANFANIGHDIVCAGVSSALMMCINGIIEVLMVEAEVQILENKVSLTLADNTNETATKFLEAFLLHLESLKDDYPQHINIKSAEV